MFKGFIPATFTPFNEDFSLNLNIIPQLAEWYRQQGIETVFICGTTGEFSSLTTDERERLAETWIQYQNEFDIWVHIGHNSQADAIRLASHAQFIGAKAISALAPNYFKPSHVEQLIQFLLPIANAAPELPFYYYDIPSMTGVHFSLEDVLINAREYIPNFAGIKYSSPDLYELQKAMNIASSLNGEADKLPVSFLYGVDEMLLSAFALGIKGAIGSTYNFATPLYRDLLTAFEQNDLTTARALQQKSVAIVKLFHQFGGIATGKAFMSVLNVDCGPVRAPLRNLNEEEVQYLRQVIASSSLVSS